VTNEVKGIEVEWRSAKCG